VTDDLATRLLAEIEKRATEARMLRQHLSMTAPIVYPVPTYGPNEPEVCYTLDPRDDLRRCAADRKIVELHGWVAGFSGPQCETCVGGWATEEGEDWPCATLRTVAGGYGLSVDSDTSETGGSDA
jgi:hypothetical protein